MKQHLAKMKPLLLFAMPVAIGLLILMLMVSSKKPPMRKQTAVNTTPVRVMEAVETRFRPRVVGYGTAKPELSWMVVAEVSGKVVDIHPQFKEGAFLPAETLLLRIDPMEYRLAARRSLAQVQLVDAQLGELSQEKANLEAHLTLERRSLSLVERELKRQVALVGNGAVSETVMEQVERDMVRSRLAVTQLENQLALIPIRRQQLNSQREQAQASHEDAKRRLAQTEIRLGFAGRVASRNVELGQPVAAGAHLGQVHGTQIMEVRADIAHENMAMLNHDASERSDLSQAGLADMKAVVRLSGQHTSATWSAKVRRLSAGLDPATRALGVIVTVQEPYAQTRDYAQLALIDGMFCEVEISGQVRSGILIPRAGLRGDQVQLVSPEDTLVIRKVVQGSTVGPWVEITEGLQVGDRVILSDVSPAVEGSALLPELDDSVQQTLSQLESGRLMP